MVFFLYELANKLYDEHAAEMDQIAVVFNNRRPSIFLKRNLTDIAKAKKKPLFMPHVMGMDDMVSAISGMQIVPKEFLLFELYDIHRNLGLPEVTERYASFEDFISIGDMMLSDFSELDLYCVDAQQIFSNLHDLKAIGEWDISSPNATLTPLQQSYLSFYGSQYQYYSQLHERLIKDNRAFSGMAYRHACDVVESMIDTLPYKYVYFVGFAALSTSEEKIIRTFVNARRGMLLSDGDAYYYNDENQEAGQFLRRKSELFTMPRGGYPNHFAQGEKQVTIVNCPENVLQAKYAARRLREMASQSLNMEQTAVVLADEKLLVPMLNSLPAEIKTANVSMGYPYALSNVNTLAIKILNLHRHAKEGRFYHKDITSLISDPILYHVVGQRYTASLINKMLEKVHAIYCDYSLLLDRVCDEERKFSLESVQFLFEEVASPDRLIELWRSCVSALYSSGMQSENPKEFAALKCWSEITKHLLELQERYNYIKTMDSLEKIYSRLSSKMNISFIGEPLDGLQVMGMLETRNLDFQRIILLSANEGVLPSGRTNNTLIPYSLKVAFGIPTYQDNDAVYANHFFSLLQRAETIDIVYNTDPNSAGKGEPSRFVLQLQDELAARHANIHVGRLTVTASSKALTNEAYTVEKDENVMVALRRIAGGIGFSPSALNLYRNCPLSFYYRYILSLKELESLAEDADSSVLGTFIHEILEDIYKTHIGETVAIETLDDALSNIDQIVDDKFNMRFGENGLIGRNNLAASVAKKQVRQFLSSEIRSIKEGANICVKGLEIKLEREVAIGDGVVVKVAGMADRIDCVNGDWRIADYKTGIVEDGELAMTGNKTIYPDKWFQVMTYAWLYMTANNMQSGGFMAGVIPLARSNPRFVPASWNGNVVIDEDVLKMYEEVLKQCVGDIMNPKMPFAATRKCSFCAMKKVCDMVSSANAAPEAVEKA